MDQNDMNFRASFYTLLQLKKKLIGFSRQLRAYTKLREREKRENVRIFKKKS